MNKLINDSSTLLILSALHRVESANESAIRDALFAAVRLAPPPGGVYSAFDTLVCRRLVVRRKGQGGASTDTFALTDMGRQQVECLFDGLEKLTGRCGPDRRAGAA